jgi:hypothetical protein
MGGTLAFAAAAGGAGSMLRQKIDNHQVNLTETATDATISAATAGVGRKLLPDAGFSGISNGKNSWLAIGKTAATKIANGNAAKMSVKTASKEVLGKQAAELNRTALGIAVDASRAVNQQEHCSASCTSSTGITFTQ